MKIIIVMASMFILIGCKTTQNNSISTTMNLKNLHTENKAVQTNVLFQPTDGKVISLQIAKNKQLAEHITKVPALLVCVSGNATYNDENGTTIKLQSGDYFNIPANVKHWVDAHEESNFLLIK
ncbi:cupin domain-containing protein [Flavobacterium sp. Sr18]|uniref:cupin domain-containing protein n=1 Tax=Flavobacterium sp. Sr18 TaxID=935222 RepID=UPI001F49AEF7|nr:cupin domain-containing protein [Flavobacterium sp. Sr18]